jgi:hypothetical protein
MMSYVARPKIADEISCTFVELEWTLEGIIREATRECRIKNEGE